MAGLGAFLAALAPPTWHGHPLRRRRRSTAVTYRVRLDLADAKPPIWRRLDLGSDLSLPDVHRVIQVAMGWEDYHLHAFAAGGRPFSREAFQFLTEDDVEEAEEGTAEADVRLDEVLHDPGDRLWYAYDFGDSWHHVLKLEKVLPRGDDDPRAACVGGRRAGPPEDCGGIGGWEEIIAAAADPGNAPEWVQESWDHFGPLAAEAGNVDVDDVNEALAELL